MPAVSQSQQALMGQAYAVKKGALEPAEIDGKYRKKIVGIAKGMTKSDLKDFAETKHKGLPKRKHVKEYHTWASNQVAQGSGHYYAFSKDQRDPLIQSFMRFIEKKEKKKAVDEEFSAPAASATNTPGMGNVAPPAVGIKGSGDTFGATSASSKKKRRTNNYGAWLKLKAKNG